MALPTLDATFASSADLPRKQMLAKWLIGELGETQAPSDVLASGIGLYSMIDPNGKYLYVGELNGKPRYEKTVEDFIEWNVGGWVIYAGGGDMLFYSSEDVAYPWLVTYWEFENGTGSPVFLESPAPSPISNYYSLPERYLWAKIAVAAGAPREEAAYINLPRSYVWSDIYNAVAGDSGSHIDWTEKQALGHIAAAYRGDTANPEALATYIDWPWRYKVASIINHLFSSYNAVIISGAGSTEANGTYVQSGEYNGRPQYILDSNHLINWENSGSSWYITYEDGSLYFSDNDVAYPWLVTTWTINDGDPPLPILTPTNV